MTCEMRCSAVMRAFDSIAIRRRSDSSSVYHQQNQSSLSSTARQIQTTKFHDISSVVVEPAEIEYKSSSVSATLTKVESPLLPINRL